MAHTYAQELGRPLVLFSCIKKTKKNPISDASIQSAQASNAVEIYNLIALLLVQLVRRLIQC